MKNPQLFIRVKSHRARSKVMRYVSMKQSYFSWHFDGEFYEVTKIELETIRSAKVKGVCQARVTRDQLSRCLSFQ